MLRCTISNIVCGPTHVELFSLLANIASQQHLYSEDTALTGYMFLFFLII